MKNDTEYVGGGTDMVPAGLAGKASGPESKQSKAVPNGGAASPPDQSSSLGRSTSSDEDIQIRRSSYADSKSRNSSFEYDAHRRQSIAILATLDNVFSDVLLPTTRRGIRQGISKTRSHSASDLPDILQPGPQTGCLSPDIVECSDKLNTNLMATRSEDHLNRELVSQLLSKDRKDKAMFEGCVYDGKTAKHLSETVRSMDGEIGDGANGNTDGKGSSPITTPISSQGQQSRWHFRKQDSSGYGTASSKGSFPSQISEQTTFNDTDVFDTSLDIGGVEVDEGLGGVEGDKGFGMSAENYAGAKNCITVIDQQMPLLSVFESDSITTVKDLTASDIDVDSIGMADGMVDGMVNGMVDGMVNGMVDGMVNGNVPHLSLLQENSNGSLELRSTGNGEVVSFPYNFGDDSIPSITQPSHSLYANEVLEGEIKKSELGICEAACSWHCSCRPAGYVPRNEPTLELTQHFFQQLDPTKSINFDDMFAKLEKFAIPSDSSTPSPSPCLSQNKYSLTEAFSYSPNLSKIQEQEEHPEEVPVVAGGDVDDRLIESLERASRCEEEACQDVNCLKAKQLLEAFETNIQMRWSLSGEHDAVLLALRGHCERCDSIKCPVPYCALLMDIDPWDNWEAMCRINQSLEVILEITDSQIPPEKFMPLSPTCRHSSPPREGEDWIVLSPLSKSHNIVLIMDTSCPAQSSQMVLKKVPLLDVDHQWEVYERLRNLDHPNLLEHLWVMEQGSLLICTRFCSAGSLGQMLRKSEEFPRHLVVKYMQQIIRGVLALHDRGIVYVNWSACNILIDDTGQRAKVSNLSLSVSLQSERVDYGGIKHTIPVAILPPELLSERPEICILTDSWGCGCLLYELTLGHKVWYTYRHESRDTVWRMLRGKVPPIPRQLKHWPEVFQACWQPSLQKRQSLTRICELLTPLTSRS